MRITNRNLSSYAKILKIPESALKVVGEGANGIVLSDGSKIAFKFPKHQLALQQLKREIGSMDAISKALSVAVPEYITQSLDKPIGEAYVSYYLLPGERLTSENYVPHRQEIANQMLQLLDEIHGMDPAGACGSRTDFGVMYQEIQTFLYPLMDELQKREITARFETYLQDADRDALQLCMVHGDLGGSNILCDRQTGRITGIIDWAEAAADDPALDYSSLTCKASVPECKADLLAIRPSLESVFQRASFIQYTFPLQDKLHSVKTGIET